MTDFSHLDAIQARLGRERQRLAAATTEGERRFREVQVRAAEREEAAEYAFLGIDPATIPASLDDLTDDELLKELGA